MSVPLSVSRTAHVIESSRRRRPEGRHRERGRQEEHCGKDLKPGPSEMEGFWMTVFHTLAGMLYLLDPMCMFVQEVADDGNRLSYCA